MHLAADLIGVTRWSVNIHFRHPIDYFVQNRRRRAGRAYRGHSRADCSEGHSAQHYSDKGLHNLAACEATRKAVILDTARIVRHRLDNELCTGIGCNAVGTVHGEKH